MVVWDKNNPDVVKLLASDKRDLFNIKMNRNGLNYVKPQQLKIASFEQDFNKAVVEVEKAVEKSLVDKPKKKKKSPNKKITPTEGVDKLGKQHESVIKAQEKVLEERTKAEGRARSGSKHYKKYMSKRWLPSRLKIGGGIGLLGWGAAQLMSTLMED